MIVDEEFKFTQLEGEYSEPELSNTEKAMLRPLAEPGGPLWKIVRKMAQYGAGLKAGVVEKLEATDLDNPEERRAIQKIQVTVIAIGWLQEQIENDLTDIPPVATQGEDDEH